MSTFKAFIWLGVLAIVVVGIFAGLLALASSGSPDVVRLTTSLAPVIMIFIVGCATTASVYLTNIITKNSKPKRARTSKPRPEAKSEPKEATPAE